MEGAKYFFHKRKAEKHTKMSFFCDVWLKSTGQAKDVAAGESAMVTGSTEQNPNTLFYPVFHFQLLVMKCKMRFKQHLSSERGRDV